MSVMTRRPDGGVWREPNLDPDGLTAADVDLLIWPAIDSINRSGWLWTTESCQGHESTPPLLGLVTDDLGRAMAVLAEALDRPRLESKHDPTSRPVTLQFHRSPRVQRGVFQFRATFAMPTAEAVAAVESIAARARG